MLNALWVVLLGMAALFVVQGIIYLFMILIKRLAPPENNQGGKG